MADRSVGEVRLDVAEGVATITLHNADQVLDRARALAVRVAKDPELARVTVRSMRLELGPPAISWPAAVELERGPQLWFRQRLEGRSQ